MTREEKMKAAAKREYDETGYQIAYCLGALWADRNPKSPWISVKDELPKCNHTTADGGSFSDMCLCMTAAGEYIPLALNEVCEEDEGLSYYWGTYSDVYDEEVDGEITHWMPIPPLKKEE